MATAVAPAASPAAAAAATAALTAAQGGGSTGAAPASPPSAAPVYYGAAAVRLRGGGRRTLRLHSDVLEVVRTTKKAGSRVEHRLPLAAIAVRTDPDDGAQCHLADAAAGVDLHVVFDAPASCAVWVTAIKVAADAQIHGRPQPPIALPKVHAPASPRRAAAAAAAAASVADAETASVETNTTDEADAAAAAAAVAAGSSGAAVGTASPPLRQRRVAQAGAAATTLTIATPATPAATERRESVAVPLTTPAPLIEVDMDSEDKCAACLAIFTIVKPPYVMCRGAARLVGGPR